MKRAEAERIARSHGWLAGEPRRFQASLLRRAELKLFEPRQFVFHAGDEPGGIYGVVCGAVAVYLPSPGIGDQLAHIVGPVVWFGQGPTNIRRTRKMTFRAMQEAALLHVPLAAINELVASEPACLRSFGVRIEINIDIVAMAVRDLLIRQVDRRIAATLLRVTASAVAGPADNPPGFVLTQSDLGEMANASRALVNKALAIFEARGWISQGYSRIAIKNRQALMDFAHGEG